jgi:uncharacterized protein (DUF983 family)
MHTELPAPAVETGEIADRPFWRSLRRGIAGHCPACGKGRLFSRALAVRDQCEACGEALHHHRADDLPPYLNILLTGHIVVGSLLGLMTLDLLPLAWLMAIAVALSVGAAAAMMRPLKGAVIASQWALHMHGFGGDES